MIRDRLPITLEAALKEVTKERFCKGHHYEDVALTDEIRTDRTSKVLGQYGLYQYRNYR